MTDPTAKRADTTRQQILRAAAHQFGARPYHDVGLDDILAEAELTKGAMYLHFRSKHALALAIIEQRAADDALAIQDLLSRRLSGLECLIDFCYLIAAHDMSEDISRAGVRLLESVGRADGIQQRVFSEMLHTLTGIIRVAITEGDVRQPCDPAALALLMQSLYVGLRQTSSLDQPEQFLLDIERTLMIILPSIVIPDRIEYFTQFIRRRTALAIRAADRPDPA